MRHECYLARKDGAWWRLERMAPLPLHG